MRNLACHPANAVILSTGFACHAQTSEFRLNLQGRAKKVPVKFCEESSVWADGLSIVCLGQWAAMGGVKWNSMKEPCTLATNDTHDYKVIQMGFLIGQSASSFSTVSG